MTVYNEPDWELAQQAKAGNEDALCELMRRYEPLVVSIQLNYYLKCYDMRDWIQEAYIVLWRIVHRFDVERTRAFGMYFKQALLNRRRDIHRGMSTQKRRLVVSVTSLKVPDGWLEMFANQEWRSPDDVVIVRQHVMKVLKKELSQLERGVILALVGGQTREEIMATFNLDKRQLHNATERIKRKIRQEFFGHANRRDNIAE